MDAGGATLPERWWGPQGYPTNLLLPQQLFHLRPLAILQFYPGPGCVTPGTLSAIWMSRTAAISKKRERNQHIQVIQEGLGADLRTRPMVNNS